MVATAPIVNLNGSSKQSLLEQHNAAATALQAAHAAMAQAFPHGRDYQCSPAGDYLKARREASERMAAVAAALEAHYEILQQLMDQGG